MNTFHSVRFICGCLIFLFFLVSRFLRAAWEQQHHEHECECHQPGKGFCQCKTTLWDAGLSCMCTPFISNWGQLTVYVGSYASVILLPIKHCCWLKMFNIIHNFLFVGCCEPIDCIQFSSRLVKHTVCILCSFFHSNLLSFFPLDPNQITEPW